MTLKRIRENYPLYETIVGYYNCEDTFVCDNVAQLNNMDDWDVPPFTEPQEGFFTFVRYMGDHKFECWTFGYWRVAGYLTTNGEDNFKLMTYSEDFGWEEANPEIFSEDRAVFTPELDGTPVNVEQVAATFDETSYVNGYIFTNAEDLKKFVSSGNF